MTRFSLTSLCHKHLRIVTPKTSSQAVSFLLLKCFSPRLYWDFNGLGFPADNNVSCYVYISLEIKTENWSLFRYERSLLYRLQGKSVTRHQKWRGSKVRGRSSGRKMCIGVNSCFFVITENFTLLQLFLESLGNYQTMHSEDEVEYSNYFDEEKAVVTIVTKCYTVFNDFDSMSFNISQRWKSNSIFPILKSSHF